MTLIKDKTTLFLFGIAILTIAIILLLAIINIYQPQSSTIPEASPMPTETETVITPPFLKSETSKENRGVFTVTFPIAPEPEDITITLAASSITDPSSPTISVPFTSQFENGGTLLVITTDETVKNDTIYTLYVRLASNNHIIVKHRYESNNGVLTIIDTD